MKKKKILLIVAFVIIGLIVATLLLYRSGKKKIDILLEMSQKMFELNEGKDENLYMKSEGDYGYTEVYRYLGTTKFIIYTKNNKMKQTSILSNTDNIDYLESDETFYIDKETLLPVKEVGKSIDENRNEITETISYDIQYNVVTEDDVQKLDETEYTLVDEAEIDKYYE